MDSGTKSRRSVSPNRYSTLKRSDIFHSMKCRLSNEVGAIPERNIKAILENKVWNIFHHPPLHFIFLQFHAFRKRLFFLGLGDRERARIFHIVSLFREEVFIILRLTLLCFQPNCLRIVDDGQSIEYLHIIFHRFRIVQSHQRHFGNQQHILRVTTRGSNFHFLHFLDMAIFLLCSRPFDFTRKLFSFFHISVTKAYLF